MTTYEPQQAVGPGRPACANCGAAYRLHHDGTCPEAYRPGTLQAAQDELAAAVASGDEARVFVARGEVQRIGGREGGWAGPWPDDEQEDTGAEA